MLAQEFVPWTVAGGILVGFAALVVLLIVAHQRARYWRHEFDQLLASRDNLRDAYHELRGDFDQLLADDSVAEAEEEEASSWDR